MLSDVLINYPDACELLRTFRKGQSANETTFNVHRTMNNRFLTLSMLGFMRSLSVVITCNVTNE